MRIGDPSVCGKPTTCYFVPGARNEEGGFQAGHVVLVFAAVIHDAVEDYIRKRMKRVLFLFNFMFS